MGGGESPGEETSADADDAHGLGRGAARCLSKNARSRVRRNEKTVFHRHRPVGRVRNLCHVESRCRHFTGKKIDPSSGRRAGSTTCDAVGAGGHGATAGRTREREHVVASHLLEPPSLKKCGEVGRRVSGIRKASSGSAGHAEVTGRRGRARKPRRGYGASVEAMRGRSNETRDPGEVSGRVDRPENQRSGCANAGVGHATLRRRRERQLSRGDPVARGTTHGNVELVVGRSMQRGRSSVRLITYRYSGGGVARHRAPGVSVSCRARSRCVGHSCLMSEKSGEGY